MDANKFIRSFVFFFIIFILQDGQIHQDGNRVLVLIFAAADAFARFYIEQLHSIQDRMLQKFIMIIFTIPIPFSSSNTIKFLSRRKGFSI